MENKDVFEYYKESYYRSLDDRAYYTNKINIPLTVLTTIIVIIIPYLFKEVMSIPFDQGCVQSFLKCLLIVLGCIYIILTIRLVITLFKLIYNYEYKQLPNLDRIEAYRIEYKSYLMKINDDKEKIDTLLDEKMEDFFRKKLIAATDANVKNNLMKAKLSLVSGNYLRLILVLSLIMLLLTQLNSLI